MTNLTGKSPLHAWLLIGTENTRKGSTIRAMTGVAREKDTEVGLASGQIMRLWTKVMSINEAEATRRDRGEDHESPGEWVKSCMLSQSISDDETTPVFPRKNILVAFRDEIDGWPDLSARHYLNALASHGATIEGIVTLGARTAHWAKLYGAPYSDVQDVSVPTNLIAVQVRECWSWA